MTIDENPICMIIETLIDEINKQKGNMSLDKYLEIMKKIIELDDLIMEK